MNSYKEHPLPDYEEGNNASAMQIVINSLKFYYYLYYCVSQNRACVASSLAWTTDKYAVHNIFVTVG